MSLNKEKFYITTPIYYVNDKPHIGHAYTSLVCDTLARFKRLDGFDVLFLTGTDEHGQKVEKSAKQKGVDPKSFTDVLSRSFEALTEVMGLSNDDFIRTTEDRHKKASQALWTSLRERDEIYLETYAGWYAVRDEAFYAEDELEEGAQGEKIAPTGAPVEWVEEPSYFFRLSKWEDALLDLYEKNPDFILPAERRNEVISFVKSGLRDLSISRTSFKWGIPVPRDENHIMSGDENHIMYVWLDALTNYLTALGYPETDLTSADGFWPADLHMVGKDILRFHAVYWPAFLMAAGLPVPKRVYAHGWWTIEGKKMSKSLGNVIAPESLIERFGNDSFRYFFLAEKPIGNDGNYAQKRLIERVNTDLANTIGNLAQRSLSMIAKNCDSKVPSKGILTEEDHQLLAQSGEALEKVRSAFDYQRVNDGIEEIVSIARHANAYIDQQEPWRLRKEDPERMRTVLYVIAEILRQSGMLLQAVVPQAAGELLTLLGIEQTQRSFDFYDVPLLEGAELPKPKPIFPRLEEDKENASEEGTQN